VCVAVKIALRRWRFALGIVVFVLAASAIFVVVRRHETPSARYASSATVRSAAAPALAVRLSDSAQLAMRSEVRNAALVSARLPKDDARISFSSSVNPTYEVVTLHVEAPTKVQAFDVAKQWANAFVVARNQEVVKQKNTRVNAVKKRINSLHSALYNVDLKLGALLPKQNLNSLTEYDFGSGTSPGTGAASPSGGSIQPGRGAAPPICEVCQPSPYLLNLLTERLHLINALVTNSNSLADLQVVQSRPSAFRQTLSQTPASRITQSVATLTPALIALSLGIVFALAAVVLLGKLDRRARTSPST